VSFGPERILVALGAVAGCLGVALSAAAAHVTGGGTLETSARFLLAHAPALIGVAAIAAAGLGHRTVALASGTLLALGLALFSGDLAWRAFGGSSLFPMAAPAGGIILMGGWALAAAAAVIGGRRGP
jgi:uncharacterized membrane protein YgdD (TMEM256/DUF423 family)